MHKPTKEEFIKLAEKGNLIPVYKQIVADLETPVSTFLKIDDGSYSYLLESVEGGEKIARFSFMGSNPSVIFKSKGNKIELIKNGRKNIFKTNQSPIREIKKLLEQFKFVNVGDLPRFSGGLVGYIGYDVVRFFEDIPDENPDKLNFPDTFFVLTDNILIFDHFEHTIKIVYNATFKEDSSKEELGRIYDRAVKQIDKIHKKLQRQIPKKNTRRKSSKYKLKMKSNFTKKRFSDIVKKAKEYIKRGDIIQAVLSQRLEVKLNLKDNFDIYRALRSINPSPYMFYLRFDDVSLIGSSPEIMVRCEDGKAELRPIAGTRKRGQDNYEDEKLMKELLADPKERAEHIMLVDLGRNDLGRVCRYKTVKTEELMAIEKYSHVMHIVSDIAGTLKEGKDQFDVIEASFPAGTVSGAPKVRAMEIIDELERSRRGPYAGCVGYFSFSGNLDTCITIRTILIKKKNAYIQAGAGIVADSKPDNEYRETLNKAAALVKAIEIAEKGIE